MFLIYLILFVAFLLSSCHAPVVYFLVKCILFQVISIAFKLSLLKTSRCRHLNRERIKLQCALICRTVNCFFPHQAFGLKLYTTCIKYIMILNACSPLRYVLTCTIILNALPFLCSLTGTIPPLQTSQQSTLLNIVLVVVYFGFSEMIIAFPVLDVLSIPYTFHVLFTALYTRFLTFPY